jgi:hypothetical protein
MQASDWLPDRKNRHDERYAGSAEAEDDRHREGKQYQGDGDEEHDGSFFLGHGGLRERGPGQGRKRLLRRPGRDRVPYLVGYRGFHPAVVAHDDSASRGDGKGGLARAAGHLQLEELHARFFCIRRQCHGPLSSRVSREGQWPGCLAPGAETCFNRDPSPATSTLFA